MKKLPILFSLIFFFSIPSRAQTYFPLKEGASWTYNYHGAFDQSGESHFVVKVLEGKKTFNEDHYFQVKTSVYQAVGGDAGYSDISYTRKDEKGNIFNYDSESGDELFFPAKLEKGQSWKVGKSEIKVLEQNGSIETPKGRYEDCIVLTRTDNGSVIYSYFKKEVGLVALSIEDQLMAYLSDYKL